MVIGSFLIIQDGVAATSVLTTLGLFLPFRGTTILGSVLMQVNGICRLVSVLVGCVIFMGAGSIFV